MTLISALWTELNLDAAVNIIIWQQVEFKWFIKIIFVFAPSRSFVLSLHIFLWQSISVLTNQLPPPISPKPKLISIKSWIRHSCLFQMSPGRLRTIQFLFSSGRCFFCFCFEIQAKEPSLLFCPTWKNSLLARSNVSGRFGNQGSVILFIFCCEKRKGAKRRQGITFEISCQRQGIWSNPLLIPPPPPLPQSSLLLLEAVAAARYHLSFNQASSIIQFVSR